MRLSHVVLATVVAAVAGLENFVAAGSSSVAAKGDSSTTDEVYGAVFRAKNGKIKDLTLVDISHNTGSADADSDDVYNFQQLDKTDDADSERAAVHLPAIFTKGPVHWSAKMLAKLLMKMKSKTKWADTRRLRIENWS